MLPTEREAFSAGLSKLLNVYNRSLDAEQVTIWWASLKRFPLDAVRAAMLEYAKERQHAPTPAAIRGFVLAASPEKPSGPAKTTHWTSQDLLCACNFAAIGRFQPDWVSAVAKAYDYGLAEVAQTVVQGHPELTPAEAAREFLKGQRTWLLPITDAVPT